MNTATGKDPEAADQIWQAAKEGGKIAAMMFPAGVVGRTAVQKGLGGSTQSAQSGSAAQVDKDITRPETTTQRRGVGRVTGSLEEFAQAYRAQRNPSATDAEVQEQFVQDNRTAAEKVLDVVRDIINAVRCALNDQNLKLSVNQVAEFEDLRNQMTGMEQLFSDALNRVQMATKNTATEGGGAKYSYAGSKAKAANQSALEQARGRLATGENADAIRKDTGRFQGMDSQWRFEIDDSGMKYHKGGDAAFSRNHPEYARYRELQLQFIEGAITEQGMTEMAQLGEIWGGEHRRLNKRVEQGNARLEDIIDHEELFRAYSLIAETVDDVAQLRQIIDVDTRPCEWATRLGKDTGYLSALYLRNDDFGIMVYMPISVAPESILNSLEDWTMKEIVTALTTTAIFFG